MFYFSGWLRTDEENVRMREAKLVSSKATKPQDDASVAQVEQSVPAISPTTPTNSYQPKFEDIQLYLNAVDVKFIETIVDSYWKAYK